MEEISSYFFKVLIPGFHKKLNLPPYFCKKVLEEKSEWATLKSRKGTWKIQVTRNGKGVISFEVGWPQFVDHHSLSDWDFLVFEHVGRFNFNVRVFGRNACEKEFRHTRVDVCDPKTSLVRYMTRSKSKSNNEMEDDSVYLRRLEKANKIHKDSKNNIPNFITILEPHHATKMDRLNIPIEFVRSNNLTKKTSVTLRNDSGKAWPARLWIQKVGQFRVHIGKGWRDFYDSNELKAGDVCVFYLNPNSPRCRTILFDVKIFPSRA